MGAVLNTCRKVDKRDPISRNRKSDEDDVTIRFFMAGMGSAGKSTIIRQLKYLCSRNKEYSFCNPDWSEKREVDSESENELMRKAIWFNIINTFDALVKQVQINGGTFNSEEIGQYARNVEHLYENRDEISVVEMSDMFSSSLVALLEDDAIQKAIEMRNMIEIQQPARLVTVFDGMDYFMKSDKIKEVFSDTYIPSHEDKIHARIATTDVVRYYFKINNHKIQIYDAGGQVSERQKLYDYLIQWQNDAGAALSEDYIFFVTSLADFNVKHATHNGCTLLEESHAYLESVLKTEITRHCGLLIFFNKKDRFLSKLGDSNCRDSCIGHLSKFLSETDVDQYRRTGEYNKKKMFDAVRKPFIQLLQQQFPGCKSFYRDTCAVDAKIMEAFFSVLKESQSQKELIL